MSTHSTACAQHDQGTGMTCILIHTHHYRGGHPLITYSYDGFIFSVCHPHFRISKSYGFLIRFERRVVIFAVSHWRSFSRKREALVFTQLQKSPWQTIFICTRRVHCRIETKSTVSESSHPKSCSLPSCWRNFNDGRRPNDLECMPNDCTTTVGGRDNYLEARKLQPRNRFDLPFKIG